MRINDSKNIKPTGNRAYINASNLRTDEVPANADGWGRFKSREVMK